VYRFSVYGIDFGVKKLFSFDLVYIRQVLVDIEVFKYGIFCHRTRQKLIFGIKTRKKWKTNCIGIQKLKNGTGLASHYLSIPDDLSNSEAKQ
jgi:hypothetical protein